jgi:hypothetical protein
MKPLFVFTLFLCSAFASNAGSLKVSSTHDLFTGNDNSWSIAGPCGSGNTGPLPLVTAGGIGVNVYAGNGCEGAYAVGIGTNSVSEPMEGGIQLVFSRPIQGIELYVDSFSCDFPPEDCRLSIQVLDPLGNLLLPVPQAVSSTGDFMISILATGAPDISSLFFSVDTVDEGPFYYSGLSGISILDPTPTPEPSSVFLFGSGLLFLLFMVYRSGIADRRRELD